MKRTPFGTLPSGASVDLFRLENALGASVEAMTYGGIVTAINIPDRAGACIDVVLGFKELAPYTTRHPYFGAITGRIAGRVAGGRLVIGGQSFALPLNSGSNHLHGGMRGFDQRLWSPTPVARSDGADSLRLTYFSPDGEENYPGNVQVAVTYTLTADNVFIVETEATADRITPLCLAHHSYFNLGGENSGTVENHLVEIAADAFVPTDTALRLASIAEPVDSHPADFRRLQRLGDVLPKLFQRHGAFYVLRDRASGDVPPPRFVARAIHPESGRRLEVYSDEQCLQFYSGSALQCDQPGKSGRLYSAHAGLCFECQGHPEGARLPAFDDVLLHPGIAQRRTTRYAFSTR